MRAFSFFFPFFAFTISLFLHGMEHVHLRLHVLATILSDGPSILLEPMWARLRQLELLLLLTVH